MNHEQIIAELTPKKVIEILEANPQITEYGTESRSCPVYHALCALKVPIDQVGFTCVFMQHEECTQSQQLVQLSDDMARMITRITRLGRTITLNELKELEEWYNGS